MGILFPLAVSPNYSNFWSRAVARGLFEGAILAFVDFPTPSSKEEILAACEKALSLAPREYPPTLPPSRELFGASDWYPFEHEAWHIGEKIRQAFVAKPSIRKDREIIQRVLQVALCRNLRRGRQSFIMLLGFVAAKPFADNLAPYLQDKDVAGHVLDTLLKMRVPEFATEVSPLLKADQTWIRNLAKKYLERYPK
jgi:hypothetical protein